jgi:hypothetical protein
MLMMLLVENYEKVVHVRVSCTGHVYGHDSKISVFHYKIEFKMDLTQFSFNLSRVTSCVLTVNTFIPVHV